MLKRAFLELSMLATRDRQGLLDERSYLGRRRLTGRCPILAHEIPPKHIELTGFMRFFPNQIQHSFLHCSYLVHRVNVLDAKVHIWDPI